MTRECMWRYRSRLGIADSARVISLGEGMTPLVWCDRLGLYVKDEGCNPGGTYRARAASLALTLSDGGEVTAPSAIYALYAAAAGRSARVTLPFDAPQSEYLLAKAAGAHVTFGDSARPEIASDADKTIAFEIVEQFGGESPGTVASSVAVSALQRGFEEMGVAVPQFVVAASVPRRAALEAALELAAAGVYPSPEAGACLIALRQHADVKPPVVLINPESGLLYAEAFSTQFARNIESDRDRLGGLITPR